jgi:hypothetical protein
VGRLPMGDEGRTEKATLRITKHEETALTAWAGSPGKALRLLLNRWLSERERAEVLTEELAVALEVPREVLGEGSTALDERNLTAALALDQVKQALPIGPEEPTHRNVGGDLVDPDGVLPIKTARGDAYLVAEAPLPGTIAAGLEAPDVAAPVVIPAHRHRRGEKVEPVYVQGTLKHRYACTVEGCPVVLT